MLMTFVLLPHGTARLDQIQACNFHANERIDREYIIDRKDEVSWPYRHVMSDDLRENLPGLMCARRHAVLVLSLVILAWLR